MGYRQGDLDASVRVGGTVRMWGEGLERRHGGARKRDKESQIHCSGSDERSSVSRARPGDLSR